jgi:membrane protease YdiL (CAAX protease family)
MEGEMTRSILRVAVSWFFIIAAIVFIQFAIYNRAWDASSVDSVPDLRIELIGKYMVGTKQILKQHSIPMKNVSQLGQEIHKYQSHNKHLSNIPIIAELSGRETALLELKRMAKYPDTFVQARDLPIFHQLYHEGSASLDSKQRLALKRYGWIGKLALSQDKPDSNPERQAVLRSASRMVILVGVFMMAIMAAVIGGLILLIIAVVLLIKGRLRGRLVMPEKPGSSLLESFAIYLVASVAMPSLVLMIAPGFRIGAILLTILSVLFSILWLRIRGTGWKGYRVALGWNRGQGFFREAGAGIVGFIAGSPLLFGACIVVFILAQYAGKFPYHPVVFKLSRNPIYLLLLVCIWAPVVEETLFRGVLFGYLRRSLSWVTSGIITGLIFAILHPQGWIAVPVLAVVGFNLSTIREWRGSIIASMTAHSLHNGSAVLMLIFALS